MTQRERERIQRGLAILNCPEFTESIQLARDVAALVQPVAGVFMGWADQLYRAAVSVPANVSEGYGRGTLPQQIQFHGHARGSAYEVLALLLAAPPGFDVLPLVGRTKDIIKALDSRILQAADIIDG